MVMIRADDKLKVSGQGRLAPSWQPLRYNASANWPCYIALLERWEVQARNASVACLSSAPRGAGD